MIALRKKHHDAPTTLSSSRSISSSSKRTERRWSMLFMMNNQKRNNMLVTRIFIFYVFLTATAFVLVVLYNHILQSIIFIGNSSSNNIYATATNASTTIRAQIHSSSVIDLNSTTTTATTTTTNSVSKVANVLLIGVEKGGTSAIANALSSMKKYVCMPTKEPHFFDKMIDVDPQWYERHFQHCDPNIPIKLDATPAIFAAPQTVYDYYTKHYNYSNHPDLKIVVSLREPISRELSQYNMKVNICLTKNSRNGNNGNNAGWCRHVVQNHTKGIQQTSEEAKLVDFDTWFNAETMSSCKIPNIVAEGYKNWCRGYYIPYLKKFIKLFGRPNILILSYQELNELPDSYMSRVLQFLNIPSDTPYDLKETYTNNSPYKLSKIKCSTQKRMNQLYETSNQELWKDIFHVATTTTNQNNKPFMEQDPFPSFELGPCEE